MKPLCQHCKRAPRNRPRGLCWTCYYTPGVRERYGINVCRTNRRGVLDRQGAAPPPAKPTDAGPGTRGKVAVLMARAARGESLFHKADCDTLEGVAPSEMCFDAENRAPNGNAGPAAHKKKGSYKPRKKRKAA